jgi:hypothetical protein
VNLSKQNSNWSLENLPNLLQKTPLKVSDMNPAHLSNPSTPNPLEVIEINKSIQQRERVFAEYGKIVRKFIKPQEAAEALIKNSRENMIRLNSVSVQLRDSKINFGQYNQEKQKLNTELITNGNLIVQKYDLKNQMSSVSTTQQAAKQTQSFKNGYFLNCKGSNNPYSVGGTDRHENIVLDCKDKMVVNRALLKANADLQDYFYRDSLLPEGQRDGNLKRFDKFACANAAIEYSKRVKDLPDYDGYMAEFALKECNNHLFVVYLK